VWIFRQRLWQLVWGVYRRERTEVAFARNLIIAFLPAAVIGALAIQYIKVLFHHPGVFVVTLILGGLIMLWVERKPQFSKFADSTSSSAQSVADVRPTIRALEDITWKQALAVGAAQCLAMVPGTSRSGATIIGGMIAGIERKTATEFSFFLAIPTMFGATVYDLYRHGAALSGGQTSAILIGFVAAFFSALILVKALLLFIARHTYRPFAWYRIALGVVVLVWLSWGN
jgi:undecaprenyl-diphosphatase